MTTQRAAVTPSTVGPLLSGLTAVVAAAVMFGAGLLLARFVVVTGGWAGSAGTWAPLATGTAAALYSGQGSARRIVRGRRRRAAAAG